MNYCFKFFKKRDYEKIVKELIEKRYVPADYYFRGNIKDFIKNNFKCGCKYLIVNKYSFSFEAFNIFYFPKSKDTSKITHSPFSKKECKNYYTRKDLENMDEFMSSFLSKLNPSSEELE